MTLISSVKDGFVHQVMLTESFLRMQDSTREYGVMIDLTQCSVCDLGYGYLCIIFSHLVSSKDLQGTH